MKRTILFVLMSTLIWGVALSQFGGLTKKDTEDFSFSLLDGRNVTLYADLPLGRSDKFSQTHAGSMMTDVIFCEKNFRFGQTWMIKAQLEKLVAFVQKGTEVRLNDAEMHAYSRAVNDLGIVYHHLGLFEKSENLTLWALEMRKGRFGKQSMATISSLNGVAALYRDMGRYAESSTLFDECLTLLERLGEKESMEYAIILNNQSTLQLALGQTETALKTSNNAIAIADRFTGDKSKDYMSFLLNSAIINQELNNHAKSEALLLRIKEIKEKRFGKKSSQYARTLNNLAALYLEIGKTKEVESLLNTALGLYKKQYGENHPTTASIIGNLGRYYYTIGDYSEGTKILLKAKQVQGYILGKYHPEYIKTLETLALIYWETGNISGASDEFLLVTNGIRDQIINYFPAMSEENKTKFWDRSRHFLMKYYSFVMANHQKNPTLVDNMYDLHLATKGLLLSESVKLKQAFLTSEDEALKKKYNQWLMMKEELAKYNAMPKKSVFTLGVNLLKFTNKVNALEQELSDLSQKFSEGYAVKEYTLDTVQHQLANGEAAIEIIRVDLYDRLFTGDVAYAALVLKKNAINPILVTIDEGKNLETRNFKLYRNSVRLKVADEISYAAYWKNVADKLSDVKKVYLSQDGIYNQINVNTLAKSDGSSVIDELNIVFVSSTREVAQKTKQNGNSSVVLLGNPHYGTDLYDELPGTKVEVESIGEVLAQNAINSVLLTEKLASESALKEAVDNPHILHISTHGYFMADKIAEKEAGFGEDIEKATINPLLRSGLILAEPKAEPGKFDKVSIESAEGEDGLLTAYEAMNFDLDQTDLVVLSACETGVGDVKAGEGVYGLQRAFQVAGADAIVTSLWKVNDEATQMLMTNFYTEWLKTGNKQEAFLNAQKVIKSEFSDPYYWGAFVMMN